MRKHTHYLLKDLKFRSAFIEVLDDILSGRVPNKYHALCANLNYGLSVKGFYIGAQQCTNLIGYIAYDWPLFSGCSTYPVPVSRNRFIRWVHCIIMGGDDIFCSGAVFNLRKNKWTGMYGRARLDLVEFIHSELISERYKPLLDGRL